MYPLSCLICFFGLGLARLRERGTDEHRKQLGLGLAPDTPQIVHLNFDRNLFFGLPGLGGYTKVPGDLHGRVKTV